MIGQTIQNYNVEELLGEGGMGTVYRATDTLLQRSVAVKILHPHLVRDTTFFERFRNEAILSAKLNHSNVAVLYNFLRDRNDNFMVMEFVDGMNLEQVLKQNGALPTDSVLKILIQTLDGLHHAHEKGILHRDIKPANLMLTRDGTVKLMDFGIARMAGSQRLTRADRVVGTLEYMAPELLDGSEPTVQSDLYAVGVLMYELLSGKMPFEANTDTTLITQILTKKPIPLRSRLNNLPKKVEEILENLLQKKPEKRFASATDLRHILAGMVTPGRVVPQMLQSKKIELEQLAATAILSKSKTEPTRLADTRVGPSKATVMATVRTNMLSTEGMILGGAVIGAIIILIGGVFFFSPKKDDKIPEDNKEISQVVIPENTVKEEPSATDQAVSFQQPTESNNKPVEKEEVKPKKIIPVEEKSKEPVKKKEEVTPKETPKETSKPVPSEPVVTTPVEPIKEPVKEEVRRSSHTVVLRNITVALALDETISSDDARIKGKSIPLRVLSDIKIDGITVIAAGGRALGLVINARSTQDGRSFLEFKPERVQAVNGDWIPLKSPALGRSGSTLEPVVFTKGTRIMPDPKASNMTLTITI